MERFKKLDEIQKYDERFDMFAGASAYNSDLPSGLTLKYIYEKVESIELIDNVPEKIKSEFNIAKNLYVYSYYSYPFKTVSDLKSISTLEYALRTFYNIKDKREGLRKLLNRAISEGKIIYLDSNDEKKTIKEQIFRAKFLSISRNNLAHGSSNLYLPTDNKIITVCGNCINQLYSF